jgi:hypothetical protein
MSWNASSGATSYGIGVRDMVTNSLVVDTTTASTSHTASGLVAGRTYRWNVAAINSSGTSSYTTPLYFTTPGGIAIPPKPTNPFPGLTSSPGTTTASTTVTLSWNASSGATSYGLGVRDMVTNTLVVDTFTTSTSFSTTNLVAGRTYKWNVAAISSAGTSAYTTPLYFTTPGATPTTPGNRSPGSPASPGPTTPSTTVTLNWSASPGASSYEIAVRDMVTNALVVDKTTGSTSYVASNLIAGRTYRWNVAALNSAGTSSFASALHFTTPSGGSIPPIPANPTPGSNSSPGTTIVGTAVTLMWSASAGATNYEIGVRDMQTNALIVDTTTTSTSRVVSNLIPGRTYRWNVSAKNAVGTSGYTSALYFTAQGNGMAPATPAALNPGSTTSPGPVVEGGAVKLNWTASAGATSYRVSVFDLNTNEHVVDETTSALSFTTSNLAPGSAYRWSVAATAAAGTSSYSTPLYFQMPFANLTVTVDSPNGGETLRKGVPQTISWSVKGNTAPISRFLISYSLDGGASYPNNISGSVTSTLRSSSWVPPLNITSGTAGRMRIRAVDASGVVLAEDTSNSNFGFVSESSGGMRFDRDIYFTKHQEEFGLFGNPSSQRPALDQLLRFIENDPALPSDASGKNVRWAAYMLATTRHETIYSYLPIEEAWDLNEHDLRSDRGPYAATSQEDYFNFWYSSTLGNGNYQSGDGMRYRGRGFVQITGKDNYRKFTGLGVDLLSAPDEAKNPQIAYKIMSQGMRMGLFRSPEKLETYINGNTNDYLHARKIIQYIDYPNDPERRANQYRIAQDIADAAAKFETILIASQVQALAVATPAISPPGGTFLLASVQQLSSLDVIPRSLTNNNQISANTNFEDGVIVSLTCVTDGSTVYYTTDGSTPTTNSNVYSAPFTVTDPMKVNALAVAPGYADSGVSSASFAFVSAPETGSVSVAISPDAAIGAGAEWRINGGDWQSPGATVSGLTPDSHTLTFKSLNGWESPQSQIITVSAGETTFASGAYTAAEGTRVIGLSGSLSFGSRVTGTTTTRTFSISNNGSVPMNVTGINYPAGLSGNWNGGLVSPGSSQTVTVSFTPATAGFFSGVVTVNSDSTSGVNTLATSGASSATGIPEIITQSGSIGKEPVGDGEHATFGYLQLVDSSNLTYTVGVSDDLLTWDWSQDQIEIVGEPIITADGVSKKIKVRLISPMTPLSPRKFFMVRINVIPEQ